MGYKEVSYEIIGPVARICHDRPKAANAELELLLNELDGALERAKKDNTVRVLIIGANGKHFSSGHDLVDGMTKRGRFTPEQISKDFKTLSCALRYTCLHSCYRRAQRDCNARYGGFSGICQEAKCRVRAILSLQCR